MATPQCGHGRQPVTPSIRSGHQTSSPPRRQRELHLAHEAHGRLLRVIVVTDADAATRGALEPAAAHGGRTRDELIPPLQRKGGRHELGRPKDREQLEVERRVAAARRPRAAQRVGARVPHPCGGGGRVRGEVGVPAAIAAAVAAWVGVTVARGDLPTGGVRGAGRGAMGVPGQG
eukprot:scaffold40421_cov61-Phaeocystis_antarctica.AAC.1